MTDMLLSVGVPEEYLTYVDEKIGWWDFVQSLDEGFTKYGRLTPKQTTSLRKIIEDKLGVELDEPITLSHSTSYSRKSSGTTSIKKQVHHNFPGLTTLSLYDLPFESGSSYIMKVYPYNSHSMVTKFHGQYYKIPLPTTWNTFTEPTEIQVVYKRTEMKGYLTKL